MKYDSMQDEIQGNEVLKRAFSKNMDELNEIEQKAVEEILDRKLAEIKEFLATRTDRGVK